MKKFVAIGFVVLALTGCGAADRFVASATGYSKTCVDGVQYIQFTSGASVQYNKEGNVVTCKENQ